MTIRTVIPTKESRLIPDRRKQMVDLHSHILPGIDDGAKDLQESLQLIRMELSAGVDTIAVTPHYHYEHRTMPEFLSQRAKAQVILNNALSLGSAKVTIVTGAEVYLTPQLLRNRDKARLCYAGTHYMLVEFPMSGYSEWIPEVLYQLELDGITPVIAHVERYPFIRGKPAILYDLVHAGALAQVNAESVIEPGMTSRTVFHFIRYNLVHVIATDTHSVKRRPPLLHQAKAMIERKLGGEYTQYFEVNSQSIIDDGEPELMDAVNPKSSRFWSFLR